MSDKKVNISTNGMTTEQIRRKADRIGYTLKSGFMCNKYDGELVRDENGYCIRGYELMDRNNHDRLDDEPASMHENYYYCRYVADLDDIESYLKYIYKEQGLHW